MDIFAAYHREIVAAAAGIAALLLFLRALWAKHRTNRRIRFDMVSVLPAIERMLEGDYRDLLRWLRRVARRYPDETRAFVLIADMLRREGSPLKATFLLRTLLYRNPLAELERAEILLSLGRAYRALGDDEKALTALKQSLAAAKRRETLLELDEIERGKGLFEDALFHRREMNSLAGADPDEGSLGIMLEAAEHALAEQNGEEAQKWLERAARREGDRPLGKILSAAAALCAGDIPRATDLSSACVDRWPEEETTLRYLFLHLPGGTEVLRTVPGPLAAVFLALFDDQKPLASHERERVEKNTLVYYYLSAQAAPPGEMRDLMAAIGRHDRMFACRACGNSLWGTVFACPVCGLPLAVKWKTL